MSIAIGFPPETLEKLKCVKCEGYLSVGPISSADSGYACGRCISDVRSISIYEEVCKMHAFPCIYDKNGCKEVYRFGKEIQNHEKTCLYRPGRCPRCEWVGNASGIFTHFCLRHFKSVISKPKLEINLTADVEKWMAFRNRGPVYLLFINYIKEQGLFVDVIKPDLNKSLKQDCEVQIRSLRTANKLILSRVVHSDVDKYIRSDIIDFRALTFVDNEIVYLVFTVNENS